LIHVAEFDLNVQGCLNEEVFLFCLIDAHTIVCGLPILHTEYDVPGEHIAYLRKFFRSHDTQTLMKVNI